MTAQTADTNPILTSENRKNIFVPTNSRELMAMKPGPLKSPYLEAMGTEISNMERNGVYRGRSGYSFVSVRAAERTAATQGATCHTQGQGAPVVAPTSGAAQPGTTVAPGVSGAPPYSLAPVVSTVVPVASTGSGAGGVPGLPPTVVAPAAATSFAVANQALPSHYLPALAGFAPPAGGVTLGQLAAQAQASWATLAAGAMRPAGAPPQAAPAPGAGAAPPPSVPLTGFPQTSPIPSVFPARQAGGGALPIFSSSFRLGDLGYQLPRTGGGEDPIADLPEEWMRAVAHIPGLSQTLPPPTRVSEYLNVHDLLASTASEDLTSILLTGFQLVLYATRTRVVKSEPTDDADDDELDRAAKRLKRQAADAARAVRLSGSLPDIFGSAQKFCTGLAGLHGLLQTAARGLREAHLIPAELKLTYSYALTTRQQELNSLSAKLNVLSAEQWTALRGALQGRFTEAMGMNSGAFSPGLQALLNDASTPPRVPRPNPSTPKTSLGRQDFARARCANSCNTSDPSGNAGCCHTCFAVAASAASAGGQYLIRRHKVFQWLKRQEGLPETVNDVYWKGPAATVAEQEHLTKYCEDNGCPWWPRVVFKAAHLQPNGRGQYQLVPAALKLLGALAYLKTGASVKALWSKRLESVRKEVEALFGEWRARWAVMRRPLRAADPHRILVRVVVVVETFLCSIRLAIRGV
ncbi:gamma-glutamylcyclotransferase [Pseudoscourfieldia marina]